MDSASLVSLLLDPVRLMVAGSLTNQRRTVAEVTNHCGAAEPDVTAAIESLVEFGIVEPSGESFVLARSGLTLITDALLATDPA